MECTSEGGEKRSEVKLKEERNPLTRPVGRVS